MKLVSIVVPCYNEEEVLPLFYDEIIKNQKAYDEISKYIYGNPLKEVIKDKMQ